MRPGAFGLGIGSGPAAAAARRPVLCVFGGTSDGDAGDGGEVRRGTLGQRRVTHLHQEVALVDDAGACRIRVQPCNVAIDFMWSHPNSFYTPPGVVPNMVPPGVVPYSVGISLSWLITTRLKQSQVSVHTLHF